MVHRLALFAIYRKAARTIQTITGSASMLEIGHGNLDRHCELAEAPG